MQNNLNNIIILSYTVLNMSNVNISARQIHNINNLNYPQQYRDFICDNSKIYYTCTNVLNHEKLSVHFYYAIFCDSKMLLLTKLKFSDILISVEPYLVDTFNNYFSILGEYNE
jgi:hypothetical protein